MTASQTRTAEIAAVIFTDGNGERREVITESLAAAKARVGSLERWQQAEVKTYTLTLTDA